MKPLGIPGQAGAAKATAPAVKVAPRANPDKWLSDDARKAEVNAAAERVRGRGWLGDTGGWLKGRGQ